MMPAAPAAVSSLICYAGTRLQQVGTNEIACDHR